jgi:hypothetical protein
MECTTVKLLVPLFASTEDCAAFLMTNTMINAQLTRRHDEEARTVGMRP